MIEKITESGDAVVVMKNGTQVMANISQEKAEEKLKEMHKAFPDLDPALETEMFRCFLSGTPTGIARSVREPVGDILKQ